MVIILRPAELSLLPNYTSTLRLIGPGAPPHISAGLASHIDLPH